MSVISLLLLASLAALMPPAGARAQSAWVAMGPAGAEINCLAVGPDGTVWAGTQGSGLLRSAGVGAWETALEPGRAIGCVGVSGTGAVYAAHDGFNGLQRSRDRGATWTQLAALNGPVTAIAFSPDGFMYAGARQISMSTDAGDSWFDKHWFSSPSVIRSLAVNWAGLMFGIPNAEGDRVVRSTDHSNWWDVSYLRKGCRALGIDPGGRIYVAADSGVYRSDDNSDTWRERNGGLGARALRCIAMPRRGELFVGSAGGGVWRSADSGATWTAMNDGLGDLDVRALALGPDGYLYAGTARGVYRSASSTTGAESLAAQPAMPALAQNHPNPFRGTTTIAFTLPEPCGVTLAVHDALGRRVALLADGAMPAGAHTIRWQADGLPPGAYWCRLLTTTGAASLRLLVTR